MAVSSAEFVAYLSFATSGPVMPFHCILHQQALRAEHKQQGSNKREQQQTVHIIFSSTLS